MTTQPNLSWALVAESAALLTAAQTVLGADRLRELHAASAERLTGLLRRGRDRGAIRTDNLPLVWLVNVVHYAPHGAATELRAGRLHLEQIPAVVTATLRPAPRPETA